MRAVSTRRLTYLSLLAVGCCRFSLSSLEDDHGNESINQSFVDDFKEALLNYHRQIRFSM